MKRFNFILTVFTLMLTLSFLSSAFAQDSTQTQTRTKARYGKKYQTENQTANSFQHGHKFVDENGDGINDNAPDADGDGIPNGQDPDYVGSQKRAGHGAKGFIDLDGDGINDNALDADGDGIPNGQDPDYVRPMDGTGAMRAYGKNAKAESAFGTGTGECDGTGPKGAAKRAGKQK